MFKTILVALDGSEHARKALRLAADLAKLYDAKLIAMHVISDKPVTPEERHMVEVEYLGDVAKDLDVGALMEVRGDGRILGLRLLDQYGDAIRRLRGAIAESLLHEAKALAAANGAGGYEGVVEDGDPSAAILATAKDKGADLIVLGSRGLGDLSGLVLGSVSHKVAHAAKCSCLTVK